MNGRVWHTFRCLGDGCEKREVPKEGMVTVKRGVVYPGPGATEPIRCETCDAAMQVIYKAFRIGRPSRRDERDDGFVATSNDGTTCRYGRRVVAEAALSQLAPGERGHLRVEGVNVFASRSTDGGRVDVTHIGRSDGGVDVGQDYGEQ